MWFLVGLGNPGKEYENTRHNTGRIVLETFRKINDFPEWKFDKKLNALVSRGSVSPSSSKVRSQQLTVLLKPQTFMNKSGDALRGLIKSKKAAEQLAVIHDDLDIPFGKFKLSFNKSAGGHRGVESVIRALKTQAFVRVRVGICPHSSFPKGGVRRPADGGFKLKKPQGDAAVEKFILGNYTSDQLATLKKLAKRIAEGLTVLITEGREKAMSLYN